jgi:hypothetical protein
LGDRVSTVAASKPGALGSIGALRPIPRIIARDVIVISASPGGHRAAIEILSRLPEELPAFVGARDPVRARSQSTKSVLRSHRPHEEAPSRSTWASKFVSARVATLHGPLPEPETSDRAVELVIRSRKYLLSFDRSSGAAIGNRPLLLLSTLLRGPPHP